MKLVRESIKLGNEYNGKWYFVIYDDNAEKLEKVEDALRAMETGASLMSDVVNIDADELGCIETTNDGDKTILKQACERIDNLHDRLFTLTFPSKNDKPC